jgi:diguanylate cyclase (GGDEF)-like protein
MTEPEDDPSVRVRPGRRLLRPRAARPETTASLRPWPVLVVDDDPDVHAMTRVLLRDVTFQDRAFEVISAASATEARAILTQRDDIALGLIDVVMETPHAGLDLVRHIREELSNRCMAIVLRTGQPGEAPEREVMLSYDVNDYRNKTELTSQKLFTALVSGLRSWINLTTIEIQNAALESRIEARTRELDTARRFSERLVDLLPIPVWCEDDAGHLRLYNHAFGSLFGLPPGAGVGRPIHDLLPLGTLDPDTDEFELEIDGTRRWMILGRGPIDLSPTEGTGAIGTLTDITERKQMEHRLRLLATTDDLTGILNRRAFFSNAGQEIDRSERYGGPVSMLMIDLDHFKRINDTFGHAIGDRALKLAAVAMTGCLRDLDILGRLGGEEFAVLLPETTLAGAVEAAERLRLAIAALVIPLDDPLDPPLRLTASLGVAERQIGEHGLDPILSRADTALYRAKATGRDRAVAWTDAAA